MMIIMIYFVFGILVIFYCLGGEPINEDVERKEEAISQTTMSISPPVMTIALIFILSY
jgi:hypothetical protein